MPTWQSLTNALPESSTNRSRVCGTTVRWKKLIYLESKHQRDRAKVEVNRSRQKVVRKEASARHLEILCKALADGHVQSRERRDVEASFLLLVEADCAARNETCRL